MNEETFGEYEYVLTENDVKDIIDTYQMQLGLVGVTSYYEFMELGNLPNGIQNGVLTMLKGKNNKGGLSEFFEEVYNFYDGRNYRKISLQDGNGYYEADLDYNVSEPIEDGYGSGYFKYFSRTQRQF